MENFESVIDETQPISTGFLNTKEGDNIVKYMLGNEEVPIHLIISAKKYVFTTLCPHKGKFGHVLVCPVRQVHRFTELTELELLEMFVTARDFVQKLDQ